MSIKMLSLNLKQLTMMTMTFGVWQNKAKISNSSVSVMHKNVRFLKKNLDYLEAIILILESPPAILCLTGTGLKVTDETRNSWLHGSFLFMATVNMCIAIDPPKVAVL